MSQTLVVLIFGFPAVFVSLVLSVLGVLKDKFWLVILGAILFIPFSYYLNGSPGLRGFAILLPLFQMGSAAAVREKNRLWAWLLLVPAFFASLWVLGVVLLYNF
jgi:dolichol kinase